MKIYQGTTIKPLTFINIYDDTVIPVEPGTAISLMNVFDKPGNWHANLLNGVADLGGLNEGGDFSLGPVIATVNEG
jgi:hypothetical protein